MYMKCYAVYNMPAPEPMRSDADACLFLLLLDNLVVDADVLPAARAPDDVNTVLELGNSDDIVLPAPAFERVLIRVVLVGFRSELLQRDVLSYPRPLGLGHITRQGRGKVLSVELLSPARIGQHRTGFVHDHNVDRGLIASSPLVGVALSLSVSIAGMMTL